MTTPSEVTTGTGDPSARVVRIDAPIASPGSCAICGKNSHPDGFADARLDFEFHGTFYLCADCVGDYARLFGYVSSAELVGLRALVDDQNAELNTLRQAVLGLESTVDGLIADAHRRNSPRRIHDHEPGNVDGNGPSNPVDQPNEGPPSFDLTGSTQGAPSEPVGPSQPVNEQGRNDVQRTSSANDLGLQL